MVRVIIDRTRCIGAGVCEAIAAGHFEIGDDGFSHYIGPAEDAATSIVDAAIAHCPNAAISRGQ